MLNSRAILEELARRRYLSDLFPKQRAFFDDPAKVKAAVAGRRGGKTWACAAGLYQAAARHRRSLNPYICLSGVSARRIMWPVLEEFNDRYKLGMRMHSHELVAELPSNGSVIFCVGGDDARKVEAMRGGKYARVIIDEAGSFPRLLLRYMCEDVLDAALLDLDGDMWLVGSPNAACVGHFYDITTGADPAVAKVPTHHWNALDNVHLPHAAEWLRKKRESKGWAEDNPIYRREYLGHWVKDASSLVFRFDRTRHLRTVGADVVATLRAVLGVDLGASAAIQSTAFVANAWAKHSRTVHTRYAKKMAGMIPSTGAEELKRLLPMFNADHAVVDAGGLGNGYIEEWRQRWGLPVVPAEKREKFAYVELLNGELDLGRLLVDDGAATRDLVDELELLQWNEDRTDFDDRFSDHCVDAWLYSWRACYAWTEKDAPDAGPSAGSREWELRKAAEAKEAAIAGSLRRAKREGKQLAGRYR